MKYIPHDYQKYCIDKILELENVGLFLDMGLGKTIITLTAIKELKYNRLEVNKVLVIAPKKVAEGTWQAEIEKWEHTRSLRYATVLGSKSAREKALKGQADIYIINRENVAWLVEYYKQDWPFDMVVCDEFSSFKNHKTKRFKALAKVKPHIRRMLGLTGTPSPNSLMDLWSQLYLLDGGERLGENFYRFREHYFKAGRRNGYVVYDWIAYDGAEQDITHKISDICISMKAEDYIDLPDLIEHRIPVVLSDKAQKAYDKMEKELVLEIEDEALIDAPNAAALTSKLLQLANGAIYDENKVWHEVHTDKIEALKETIESLEGKGVLVFYNFQHDRERILEALKSTKLRYKVLEGLEDQEAWNRGELDILLAHPASAAYGLNLQKGGSHIIWFGLTWNYEQYVQANARLHRQGQADKVFIHILEVKGSRDEDVAEALARKENAQDYILESLKARIRRYKE